MIQLKKKKNRWAILPEITLMTWDKYKTGFTSKTLFGLGLLTCTDTTLRRGMDARLKRGMDASLRRGTDATLRRGMVTTLKFCYAVREQQDLPYQFPSQYKGWSQLREAEEYRQWWTSRMAWSPECYLSVCRRWTSSSCRRSNDL